MVTAEGRFLKFDEAGNARTLAALKKSAREKDLKAKVTLLETEIEVARAKREAANGELEAAKRELDAARDELGPAKAEAEISKSQLEATTATLETARKELDAAREEAREVKVQLAEATSRVQELERQAAEPPTPIETPAGRRWPRAIHAASARIGRASAAFSARGVTS